jgi:hypothetical protein
MLTLRFAPHLFAALRAGFEAGAGDDVPLEQEQVAGLRLALAEAAAGAVPGLPIIVTLESVYELYALADCFEIGAEVSAEVSVDQRQSILALINQARP